MLDFWNLQGTFFIGSYGISFAFWWGDHFLDVGMCFAMKSFEDDQQCFEFNPVFDWKPVKRNECRSYAIINGPIWWRHHGSTWNNGPGPLPHIPYDIFIKCFSFNLYRISIEKAHSSRVVMICCALFGVMNPYPPGLLHWYLYRDCPSAVTTKWPWWIWINSVIHKELMICPQQNEAQQNFAHILWNTHISKNNGFFLFFVGVHKL